MIEEKHRLTPLIGQVSNDTEEVYLSNQGQMAMKSWFKIGKYTKWLAWGYAVMAVSMVFFAIANRGLSEPWFWQKIVFLIIASTVLTFISIILRMMVYSGSPIPALREDLITVDDDEKIVTANNFYFMMNKILLIPTMTMALAAISTQSHILDITTLRNTGSLASVMGFIFVAALIINATALVFLYLFLTKVKRGNKSLETEIDRRYKEQGL